MEDIVVSGAHRGRGIASLLMRDVERRARAAGARVLWLETQNTNFPAIQFYRKVGFRLCGMDDTLYDIPFNTEVALFFSKSIEEA